MDTTINEIDNLIIGAGITGVYLGYRLNKLNKKFVILDKNNYIGGRAYEKVFHNKLVSLGAGIISDHNTHLLKLIDDLKLPIISFDSEYRHIERDYNNEYNRLIDDIDQKTKNLNKDMRTFDFIKENYGNDILNKMLSHAEYIEYMYASIKKTMEGYPKDDLYLMKRRIMALKGGWTSLIEKLCNGIYDNIKLNREVSEINYNNGIYEVKTNHETYLCKKLFFATDFSLKHIRLSGFELPKLLDKIGTIPYFRMYTYHKSHNIDTNLIGETIFRKIIPINENILMSAYADSVYADKCKESIDSVKSNELKDYIDKELKYFSDGISTTLDHEHKYWKYGVHYYKPDYNHDKKYYEDEKGYYIVGEMISAPQGNVEACIRSVDELIENK